MVRVLVAASSVQLQELFERAARTDADVQIVGLARSGTEAIAMARELLPDLVAVGLRLRDLDDAETVKEIMIEAPVPIVMVAQDIGADLGNLSVRALASGALAVIPAPLVSDGRPEEASTRKFLSTLKAMSQVKVVRRWRERPGSARRASGPMGQATSRIVAIAASTGGPAAILAILRHIPAGFPVPILVVQHISSGFINGFAASLDAAVSLKVKVATDGDPLKAGTVYLAPDNRQLGVANRSRIRVADDPPVHGFRPSGTYLFDSIARVFGNKSLAVILTGMGTDGAEGLREIRKVGGQAIAQDETTSVVFGMPKAAIDSGFVDHVLPLDGLAHEIIRQTGGAETE
jgi:two-component system chemotaxis response regulator CheB